MIEQRVALLGDDPLFSTSSGHKTGGEKEELVVVFGEGVAAQARDREPLCCEGRGVRPC
jgi:hypothetical protein